MDESGQWYGNQVYGVDSWKQTWRVFGGIVGLCALWWGFEVPVGVSARMSLYFVYRWNVVWHIVLRCFQKYRLSVRDLSLFCVYA